MKKQISFLFPFLFLLLSFQAKSNIRISEINYLGNSDLSHCDNTFNSYCRGFEIEGPDDTDLSGYSYELFDCSGDAILSNAISIAGVIKAQGSATMGSIWYDSPQLNDHGGEVRLYDPQGVLVDNETYGELCDGSGEPSDAGVQTDANCSLQSFEVGGNEVWGGSLLNPLTFLPSPGGYNEEDSQSCQSTTLYVEFIDFSAIHVNNATILRWSTATETNSSHFIVERSTDGQQFVDLGEVQSTGKAAQYQYVDAKVPQGLTYYRLTQVDNSGEQARTEVLSVQVTNSEGAFSVFPNPTTDQLTILLPQSYDVATVVEVYDAVGLLIQRQKIAAQSLIVRVDVSDLAKGHYYVRLLNGTEINSQRFIKK